MNPLPDGYTLESVAASARRRADARALDTCAGLRITQVVVSWQTDGFKRFGSAGLAVALEPGNSYCSTGITQKTAGLTITEQVGLFARPGQRHV